MMTYEIIKAVDIPPIKRHREMNGIRKAAIAANEQHYIGNPCKQNHSGKRLTKDGQCIECRSSMRKKLNNKQRPTAKNWELKKNFGITLEQYNEMFEKQNGLCAICGQAEKVKHFKTGVVKRLAVDHCHDTKKIRGLLCYQCNIGIGTLLHSPELLRKAALYCEEI